MTSGPGSDYIEHISLASCPTRVRRSPFHLAPPQATTLSILFPCHHLEAPFPPQRFPSDHYSKLPDVGAPSLSSPAPVILASVPGHLITIA